MNLNLAIIGGGKLHVSLPLSSPRLGFEHYRWCHGFPSLFATYFLRRRDGVEDDAITLTPQTPSIEEEIGEEIDR
jgi:hypothetical protein